MPRSVETLTVVAAVVLRGGRVLLTQRPENTHLPLHWEFPGGKVEADETPADALRREIAEEIGVQAAIEEPFAFSWHDDGEKKVLLLVYAARIVSGEPRAIGCRDLGWFDRDQVAALLMPPADGPILARLAPLLAGGDQNR